MQDVHMSFGAIARSTWAQIKTNNTPVIIRDKLGLFWRGRVPGAAGCSSPARIPYDARTREMTLSGPT